MSLSPKKQSPTKLDIISAKLKAVDKYITRSENLPQSIFMHPELLGYTGGSSIAEITNEVKIEEVRFVLLDNLTNTYYFYFVGLPVGKLYYLRIETSKVLLEIGVFLDGIKKGSYSISKTQGIIIEETNWKKAEFTVTVKKYEKMSLAKIQVSTMTTEFKLKVNKNLSQKKFVQEQLKEFIQENIYDHKIKEIVERKKERRLKMIKEREDRYQAASKDKGIESMTRTFRSCSLDPYERERRKSLGSVLGDPRIHSAQLKRDFQNFENSKEKLIKHIHKMKPSKAEEIMENEKFYKQNKRDTAKQFAILSVHLNFFFRIHKLAADISKKKILKIHVHLKCKRFIKNFLKLCKPKVSLFVLTKIAFESNVSSTACLVWNESEKKAQKRIVEALKTHTFKCDFLSAAEKALKFQKSCKVIQKAFKKRTEQYKIMFKALAIELKGYEFETSEEERKALRKYKKHCIKKGKNLLKNFILEHSHIASIVQEMKEKRMEELVEKSK